MNTIPTPINGVNIELHTNDTAQNIIRCKHFLDIASILDNRNIHTTHDTALLLNNFFNYKTDLIDGSIHLNGQTMCYFGYRNYETKNNGVYDFIIKDTTNKTHDTKEIYHTFNLYTKGTNEYNMAIVSAIEGV